MKPAVRLGLLGANLGIVQPLFHSANLSVILQRHKKAYDRLAKEYESEFKAGWKAVTPENPSNDIENRDRDLLRPDDFFSEATFKKLLLRSLATFISTSLTQFLYYDLFSPPEGRNGGHATADEADGHSRREVLKKLGGGFTLSTAATAVTHFLLDQDEINLAATVDSFSRDKRILAMVRETAFRDGMNAARNRANRNVNREELLNEISKPVAWSPDREIKLKKRPLHTIAHSAVTAAANTVASHAVNYHAL